jgi:hypothetical protein
MYGNVKKIPLRLKGSVSATGAKRKSPEQISDRVLDEDIRGRILASGTSVTGFNTFFKEEISIGDVIVIVNPQSHLREERTVTEILSNRQISVHQKFSADFVSTVEARVRREGARLREEAEAEVGEDTTDREKLVKELIKQKIAQKTSETSAVVVVQKTGNFGYKTKVEEVKGKLTKEQELDLRAKRVHDKYC